MWSHLRFFFVRSPSWVDSIWLFAFDCITRFSVALKMIPSCCYNNTRREKDRCCFRIPKIIKHRGSGDRKNVYKTLQAKWLSDISRADLNDQSILWACVCSNHFVSAMIVVYLWNRSDKRDYFIYDRMKKIELKCEPLMFWIYEQASLLVQKSPTLAKS